MRRTIKVTVSFDADQYPGWTSEEICKELAVVLGEGIAKGFSSVPSYLNTKVEVVNEAVVHDLCASDKE